MIERMNVVENVDVNRRVNVAGINVIDRQGKYTAEGKSGGEALGRIG